MLCTRIGWGGKIQNRCQWKTYTDFFNGGCVVWLIAAALVSIFWGNNAGLVRTAVSCLGDPATSFFLFSLGPVSWCSFWSSCLSLASSCWICTCCAVKRCSYLCFITASIVADMLLGRGLGGRITDTHTHTHTPSTSQGEIKMLRVQSMHNQQSSKQ